MADVRISELPAVNPIAGADVLEVLQGGVNKSGTIDEVLAYINSKQSFSQDVGDGVAVNIAITHNLNSRDLHVTVRRSTTPWDEVVVDNEATSLNIITLKFGAIAPSSGQFRVTVSK